MLPATESEATSPGSDGLTVAGTRDEWLPYDNADTADRAGSTAPTSSAVDGPTLTFTTAAGHQVILTYQDLLLLALFAGASAAAWRGMNR